MVTKNKNTSSLKKCEDDMTNMNHTYMLSIQKPTKFNKTEALFWNCGSK